MRKVLDEFILVIHVDLIALAVTTNAYILVTLLLLL